jgi:PAS domain S-box-containing protein/putative nucleotidyltransferase with HDIG domain
MRQPVGASNRETQEEAAISQDPPPSRASKPEEEDKRQPLGASSGATTPGASPTTGEPEAAAGEGGAAPPGPSLQRVLDGISASLDELQAVVREVDLQSEKDLQSAEPTGGPADFHYRELFGLAPEAYLVTDAQAIIQEANQAAGVLLQLDPVDLQGKLLAHFVMEADRAAFQTSLIRVREGGEQRNWEVMLQPETGKPFAVSVSVRAQTDHQDHVVRVLWLLRDVREAKTEEDRLKTLLSGIRSSFYGIVEAFAEAVEIKDPQTAGHQQRVAQLAVAIAREMNFSLNRLEGIRVAGLLHDIGKIAVPIEILTKPGPLSDLESEFVKTHCRVGYDLLKPIDFPWPVLQAIVQHHERLDGSGYPAGLTDDDIILEAKILGVADVVEAMVGDRSYGLAQGLDKALKEIHENLGVLYDPEVGEICIKLFREKGFTFN